MSLQQELLRILTDKVESFSFPRVTYDFKNGEEIRHESMRSVESYINELMMSDNTDDVKDGLSNVIFWGNYRHGAVWYKVNNLFRNRVTKYNLEKVIHLLNSDQELSLRKIYDLGLPYFANISFISKFLMFLDPQKFVTLDLKLMKIAEAQTVTFFRCINNQPNFINVTNNNEDQYKKWCKLCQKTAEKYLESEYAVDVERAIFQLVDEHKVDKAAEIIYALMNELNIN